ncbi:MAG: hypothetical protein OXN81_17005 [Alphaproteobacteria bacterium]|nr:hypothetical protein [Alphaproteobacteria bacterium]
MKATNALAAALAVLLLTALAWHGVSTQKALAHDAAAPGGHAEPGARSSRDLPVVAALRANGAQVTDLGERGGLSGHFVELADGDAYGLYVTPDGHAVAGLLYGPDGTLLTGRQIAAARNGSGGGVETTAVPPVREADAIGEVSGAGRSQGGEAKPSASVQLAHAYAHDPALPGSEALFERSVSAFGFTLGRAGPPVVAFADPGCRWSRAAVARLARLALDGRLRLRTIPVGVLGAASAREAAAVASAADPVMAWFEGAGGPASPEGGRRIARNNALFDAWGAGAVPLIAWRALDGRVVHRVGDIDDINAWLEALRHE